MVIGVKHDTPNMGPLSQKKKNRKIRNSYTSFDKALDGPSRNSSDWTNKTDHTLSAPVSKNVETLAPADSDRAPGLKLVNCDT